MGFVRVETVFTLTETSQFFFQFFKQFQFMVYQLSQTVLRAKKVIHWEICFTLDGS